MFWRKKALLAKIESAYGTDAVPTGAANAILAHNVNLRPLEGGEATREFDRPYLGGRGAILVNTHVALDFEVELAGAGAVDAAPPIGPLLRACGLAETITPTTGPVEYDPVSESFESCTIYLNLDGVLHKLLGARGTVGVTLTPGQMPAFRFQFMGLFAAPTDAALPTPDYSGFQTPAPVTDANTTTFTIDGYAAVMESFTADLGQQVEGRFLVNSEGILITDRNATGEAQVEAVILATKDFFGIAQARTQVALACVHGTVAGNVVKVDAPTVEIGRPSYGQSQGITMLTLPLMFVPDSGDDELKISFQ